MRGIVETGGRNRADGRAAARDAVHLPGDGGARLPVHGGGELLRCKDFNGRRIRRDSDVCLRGDGGGCGEGFRRSEEHTSELQSRLHLVCRLLLEKKKKEKCKRRVVETEAL